MSHFPEQPFSEVEERYFLAEILKKSGLPTTALINIIKDSGIDPAWTEIALPNGRSLSSCQQAYNALLARTQQQAFMPAPAQESASKRLKRPYSMGDATAASPLTREIQPRPPTFSTVNGLPQPLPGPVTIGPIEPPRKKRGRPTKSEFERRQAEARERGEVWPKPRNKGGKTPRTSTEGMEAGTSAAAATSSSAPGDEMAVEGGGNVATAGSGEESSMASAAPQSLMYPPSTPGSAPPSSPAGQRRGPPYEAMMSPAGQAHHSEPAPLETEGGPVQPPQSLLADLRTHSQMPRGAPLHQRPPHHQGPFPPYPPPLTPHFQGYQMEERPPGSRQQQQ